MAGNAGAFLQGVIGGGQFITNLYDREEEKEWRKSQREMQQKEWSRQESEWQREDDLRKAQSGLFGAQQELNKFQTNWPESEDAKRMAEFEGRYNQVKKNIENFKTLPEAQQQEAFKYFTTDVLNEVMPELVQQGEAPGEHKALIGGKMVPGGMVPMVQVTDDAGNEIRRGPMTMNRSSAPDDQAMFVPTQSMVDYLVRGTRGEQALQMLQDKINILKQDVIRHGGTLSNDTGYSDAFIDKHGNLVQKNLEDNSIKVLSKAKDMQGGTGGKRGSGGSGSTYTSGKNFQVLNESEPFELQIGEKDGQPVYTDATRRRWRDPGTGTVYEGVYHSDGTAEYEQAVGDTFAGRHIDAGSALTADLDSQTQETGGQQHVVQQPQQPLFLGPQAFGKRTYERHGEPVYLSEISETIPEEVPTDGIQAARSKKILKSVGYTDEQINQLLTKKIPEEVPTDGIQAANLPKTKAHIQDRSKKILKSVGYTDEQINQLLTKTEPPTGMDAANEEMEGNKETLADRMALVRKNLQQMAENIGGRMENKSRRDWESRTMPERMRRDLVRKNLQQMASGNIGGRMENESRRDRESRTMPERTNNKGVLAASEKPVESKTGAVTDNYLDAVKMAESSGRADAKNPRSSATGHYQFTNKTWTDMVKRYRPDLAGMDRGKMLSLRKDPKVSREIAKKLTEDNVRYLQKKNIDPKFSDLYLAHVYGPYTASRIIKASPDTMIKDVVSDAVIKANPYFADMTVAEMKRFTRQKMNLI